MTDKHKKAVGIAAFLIFLLVCGFVTIFIGRPMLQLAREPEKFRQWVDGFGGWGRLIFVCIVVLQVIVALIPGEPVELCAGYAFGTGEGLLWCLVGIGIGSAIIFLAVRRWGVKLVEVFFSPEKINSLWFLPDPKRLRLITVLVMLIPGTPKDMLSYAAGLTKLSLWEWVAIAVVARIPSVLTSTLSGSAVGDQNYVFAVIAYGITLMISLVGVLFYNRFSKRNEKKENDHGENKGT